MTDFVEQSLAAAIQALSLFANDRGHRDKIRTAVAALTDCFGKGGSVLACGNGGSMCDAIHFAEELAGRYRQDRTPLPAAAISDPGYISCVANDYGYQHTFSRYVQAWSKKGDVLLAISTSGKSPNILAAVEAAKTAGATTLALTGKKGGELAELADIALIVPSETTERIQEVHTAIVHLLIEGVERTLFPDNYR